MVLHVALCSTVLSRLLIRARCLGLMKSGGVRLIRLPSWGLNLWGGFSRLVSGGLQPPSVLGGGRTVWPSSLSLSYYVSRLLHPSSYLGRPLLVFEFGQHGGGLARCMFMYSPCYVLHTALSCVQCYVCVLRYILLYFCFPVPVCCLCFVTMPCLYILYLVLCIDSVLILFLLLCTP